MASKIYTDSFLSTNIERNFLFSLEDKRKEAKQKNYPFSKVCPLM